MIVLALDVLAILIAPLLDRLVSRARALGAAVDGAVRTLVAGLVALHLLPEAFHNAGWWALLATVAGVAGPWLVEKPLGRPGARGPLLALAAVGVAAHAAMDGAALATPSEHSGLVAAAVVLHTVPFSVLIWRLFGTAGATAGRIGLGVSVVGVIVGRALGAGLASEATLPVLGAMESFVGGTLLHALAHAPPTEEDAPRRHAASGAGALVAVFLLGWTAHPEPAASAALWAFSAAVAPALLAGYAAAAGLRALGMRSVGVAERVVGGVVVAAVLGPALGGLAALVGLAATALAAPPHESHDDHDHGPAPALQFALGALVDRTLPWVVVGIAAAGLVLGGPPPSALPLTPPLAQVAIAALVGVPIYTSTAGVAPVLSALILRGFAPGAALAFLVTGPGTDLATLRAHPRGAALAAVYAALALVLGGAAVAGGLTAHPVPPLPSPLAELAVAAVAALAATSLLRQGVDGFVAQILHPRADPHAEHAH